MKRLKLFFACLLMTVLSIGQMWATDEVVYTLTPVAGSDNGYATNEDIDITDGETTITWNVTGNATMIPWRIGGKNLSGVNREVYSKDAMSAAITKVELTVGTASSVTVNSLKLIVASDEDFSDVIDEVTKDFTASSTITFEPTSPATKWATGAYYKFVFKVTIGSNNKYVQFTEAKFYAEAAAPAFTITALSNDESKGTVSLTGSVITGSPKANCCYASPAYTVTSGNATVAQSGNAFTVTPSSDCTVRINFEAIPQYTVTWNNNGSTSTSQVLEGNKPVFPATPAACDATSTTFIGWATAPWTGKLADLSEKTVYTSASAMPDVDAAITYYAVFAKSSGSASNLFNWEGGGKTDLLAIEGIVSSSLDADYAASHDPYLVKWNSEGKYLIIPVSAQPGKVSVGFKMIGGNTTSTVDIQESTATDGEFTNVETLTISGATNDVVNLETTNAFKSTTRAIKLLYHKGSNVGLGPISIEGAVSMSDYMTTCCTKYNVAIAAGIENGSVTADIASACEGTEITLTPSAAGGYHFDAWDVYKTGESTTKITVTANKFDMPAYDVTVSASFEHDPCENLDAPTLNEIVKTYNSANIAWNTVTDAVAYAVSVVKDGESEPVFSGNVTELSKALENLEPETQYNYTIMAVGDGTVKCADGNGVLEGNFTTEALPTAVLTLMENGNEVAGGSHAITVPFALPTAVTHTCGKTFVGWTSKSDFEDGDESLSSYYEKGAEFTFVDQTGVTLYAVYADGGATEETATVSIETYADANSWENGTQYNFVTLDENITATASSGTNTGKYYTTGNEWRFYQGESATITIATTVGELSSIKFTYNVDKTGILEDAENNVVETATAVAASGTSAVYHVANSGTATNGQVRFTAIEVKYLKPGTYSHYSITCAAAPEVVIVPEEVNATAAGVAAGVIEALYENVDEEHISVALFNDAACTEAFDGGWLTASINGDKNIAYTVEASDVYVARTAYIKLTAPETTGATAPAVVIIPVSQEAKALVFSSLEELVDANLASGTEVTVSFSNILITEVYTTNAGYRYGLYLNVKDKDGENDIELFYNKQGETEQVPDTWVKNGYVSATNLVTTWTEYKGQWELAMQGATWSWENGGITYGAPKAVKSVVVSGEPAKKTYVDGEKFNPAGLTVTVNYTIGDPEIISAADADWEFTPERLAKGETGISVKATYNTVQSAAFNVTGLTVGDIQLKTVAEFIAAGNADMRCYLEGIVSDIETGNKLKYGNFNLTDASGTIYVYGCLNKEGEAQKFDELDVHNGDKIKVIAEDYDYYNTKHEAKNVQFVSKKSPATMTFNPMALEFGDVETMAPATITLADASDIEYSIKDGSDDCVTIAGDQITAKSVAGTATIVATLDETPEYVGATVEFVVTVTAPITKYAITFDDNGADGGDAPEAIANQVENAEVTLPANAWTKEGYKFDGWKVINNTTSAEVSVAAGKFSMPASAVTIQAQWAEIPSWAYVYDNNVVVAHTGSGVDNGTITIGSDDPYLLVKAGSKNNTGTIVVTVPAGATDLHFHAFAWGGKTAKIQIAGVEHASISEFDLAGEAGAEGSGNDFALQGVPVDQYFHVSFDAVAEETEITFSKAEGSADNRFFFYGVNQVGGNFGSYHRNVTSGNYGTICLPYAGTISGATLFEIADYENDMIYVDEILSGEMVAGRPYIFYATSGSLNVAYTANIETAAGSANGLHGFYDLNNMATDEAAHKDLAQNDGNYILYQNQYWLVSGRDAYINNFRAYIKLDEISTTAPDPTPGQAPRRRVAMSVHGEQVATGFENLNASEKPVKLMIDGNVYILRGEKLYDVTGRLVK